MNRISKLAAAVTTTLMLGAGCASVQTYRLPVTPRQSYSMRPALVNVAQNQGYRTMDNEQNVAVYLPGGDTIQYTVLGDTYDMMVVVDRHGLSDAQVAQRNADDKAKGDQLWAIALEVRRQNEP